MENYDMVGEFWRATYFTEEDPQRFEVYFTKFFCKITEDKI